MQASLQGNGNGGIATSNAFDPFVTTSTPLSAAGAVGPVSANPYAHDTAAAMGAATYFASQTGFQQPVFSSLCVCRVFTETLQVQYHLYAPVGPHNQNTLGYQRNVHDLFLPNDFREELQKKAAATLQTLPSTLRLSQDVKHQPDSWSFRHTTALPSRLLSLSCALGSQSPEERRHLRVP